MTHHDSVERLIADLRAGSNEAVAAVFERYRPLILRYVRARLPDAVRQREDEEDVAQTAFKSFFHRLQDFDRLATRDDLLRVLLRIALRKALNRVAKHHAQRRDCRRERPLVSRDPGDTASPRFALEASGADPATAAEATDQIQHLLSLLDTTQLRIVRWKLDGLSNSAIAAELGVVERTIERKTELIRSLWEQTLLS